ncbi:hypothetical protein ACYJ1Y_15760 [Natrialbaceae archaeon A-gly3]
MALHFRKATGVFRKTMPFVALRLAVGLGIGLATVLYFGIVAWIGFRLLEAGTISGWIGIVGVLLAVGIFLAAWRLAARYVLYLVKAGHIAVIAYVVETGEVPENQLQYGKAQVREHFAETSALFAVDKLIKAVVRQFNDAVVSVSGLLSFSSSLQRLIRLVGRGVAVAASYIDEAIIAHVFVSEADDRWTAAKDGVILYGQNWKPVLGSTLLIVIGMYIAAFGLFMALTPVAGALGNLSATFELVGWVVVGGMVLTVYTGLLKPWVKTVVITTFLVESRGDSPESEMTDRLAGRSETFQELVNRADSETPAAKATGD